ALHAGGHRFDSDILHQVPAHAGISQGRHRSYRCFPDGMPAFAGTKSSLTYWDRVRTGSRPLRTLKKKHNSTVQGTMGAPQGAPAPPFAGRGEQYKRSGDKLDKGVWGMPRLSEATKDAISCEK